jgi:Fic family protein
VPGLPIYQNQEEKRQTEIRNGAIQFWAVLDYAKNWIDQGKANLTPDLLKELQRLAINQVYTCAGTFRDGSVQISSGKHKPPDHTEVPELVVEMCEYIHREWDSKTPIHLASYLMWRINWIHPFFGGNGRTARATAHLVLCGRLGFIIPGAKTMPDLIVANRSPYYSALRKADEAWEEKRLDLRAMEEMMSSLLAQQLVDVHKKATGAGEPPSGLLQRLRNYFR